MKKVLTIALAISLIFAFSACKKKTEDSSGGSDSNKTETESVDTKSTDTDATESPDTTANTNETKEDIQGSPVPEEESDTAKDMSSGKEGVTEKSKCVGKWTLEGVRQSDGYVGENGVCKLQLTSDGKYRMTGAIDDKEISENGKWNQAGNDIAIGKRTAYIDGKGTLCIKWGEAELIFTKNI